MRPQTAEYLKIFDQYYHAPEVEDEPQEPQGEESGPFDVLKALTDYLSRYVPWTLDKEDFGFFRRITALFESAESPHTNVWDRRTHWAMLWRLLLIKELGRDPTKHELKERLEDVNPDLYPPTIRWAELWKKPGLENLPQAKPRRHEEMAKAELNEIDGLPG